MWTPALTVARCFCGYLPYHPLVGTLGDFDLMALELGLPLGAGAYASVRARHHATIGTRLLPMVVGGCGGFPLELTYRRRDALLAPAGVALAKLFPAIPGGKLVFFTSKGMMRRALATWRENGVWGLLAAAVGGEENLHVDDAKGAEASAEVVRRYKEKTTPAAAAAAAADTDGAAGGAAADAADGATASSGSAPAAAGGGGKAVLFAVLRGRSSEGADFTDATCRAVFVIGAHTLRTLAPR